jgi:hypothetical protein
MHLDCRTAVELREALDCGGYRILSGVGGQAEAGGGQAGRQRGGETFKREKLGCYVRQEKDRTRDFDDGLGTTDVDAAPPSSPLGRAGVAVPRLIVRLDSHPRAATE